ncbi:MAG: phosphoglycerate mutase family protein [Alphaproteobacteria bacterium]|nr:phosphoglycerate mutase family protein [Alphaproteobacteria bacterium]
MSARLFLVRHGEAAAAWGDDPDPGLSALGRSQAEAAAERLLATGVTRALTSPLLRCRETAAPWERRAGVGALIEPAVAEIPTPAGVADRKVWLRTLMAGAWPSQDDAPDLAAWRARLVATLRAQPGDTIVFTHFVAINVALGAALGVEDVVVRQPANAAIVAFEIEAGRLRLVEAGAQGAGAVL